MTWVLLVLAFSCALVADQLFSLAEKPLMQPAEAFNIGIAAVGFWLLATALLVCAMVGPDCSTLACDN